MSNHLLRSHAPIPDGAWSALDDEARTKLVTQLAARKMVDFVGPLGWTHSATNLGRTTALTDPPGDGVAARQRIVLPLLELRVPFDVSRSELQDVERGAADIDLDDLDRAVSAVALAENSAIFHGYAAAGIKGITAASTQEPIPLGTDPQEFPRAVAVATDRLKRKGIGGPYGLAIGPAGYTTIIETTEHGGYLLLDHLRHVLDGPVVWAPGVTGGVVVSLRGGDFLLESGEDLSIGYTSHTEDVVRLYLEESFSFRVTEPDAAVALV
jgi:uncharacterized linocin/CFP29 family protein